MIASNERMSKVPTIIEVALYVLMLVGVIFGAYFLVAFMTRQTDTGKKLAAKQMNAITEPAEKELKAMDEEPISEPVNLPQPTIQAPVISAPTPAPPVYVYTPPPAPPVPQRQQYANEPYLPSSVSGAAAF